MDGVFDTIALGDFKLPSEESEKEKQQQQQQKSTLDSLIDDFFKSDFNASDLNTGVKKPESKGIDFEKLDISLSEDLAGFSLEDIASSHLQSTSLSDKKTLTESTEIPDLATFDFGSLFKKSDQAKEVRKPKGGIETSPRKVLADKSNVSAKPQKSLCDILICSEFKNTHKDSVSFILQPKSSFFTTLCNGDDAFLVECLNEASDDLADRFSFKKQRVLVDLQQGKVVKKQKAEKVVLFDFSPQSQIVQIKPVREAKNRTKTAVAATSSSLK